LKRRFEALFLPRISDALKDGDAEEVRRLTLEALKNGVSPERIMNEGLLAAMDEIGKKFKANEIFIPDVLMSSRAMHAGLRMLRKRFYNAEGKKHVKVLIGTVAGDLHDIGKDMVIMFMGVKGIEVINLGIDIPAEEFVAAVKKHKPQILAMSSLLTTTLPAMGKTIEALEKAGLRDKVKILVGGGPVTKKFAEEIGSDGYAYDAKSAAEWVLENFL
jgi:5-methyltetrahydrofolate--homocysteine methyltransferase